MIVLSVATHNERMMDIFQKSCENNNCDLRILGFGDKWQGFGWRWTLIYKWLESHKIEDSEIVLVTDAFDSCIVAHSKLIETKFKEFNSPMVFSCEPSSIYFHWISAYYRWRVFGPDPIINGGSYIGYCGAIKKFIAQLKYKPSTDDQRFLTSLYKMVHMKVDFDYKIFFHHCAWMKHKGFIPDTCVVTFPASGYTPEILQKLGYDYVLHSETWGECMKVAVRRVKHYFPFFWREVVVILVAVLGLGVIPLILGLIAY